MGPDILRWGGGLPREGVGAEKFGMFLEAREAKLFGRDIPGFCQDILEVPEKYEKKKVSVQFSFPNAGPVLGLGFACGRRGEYTRENGTTCPFGVFSQVL